MDDRIRIIDEREPKPRPFFQERMTMEEVGQLLGISRERVKQLEHKALQKLSRHPVMQQLAQEWWGGDA